LTSNYNIQKEINTINLFQNFICYKPFVLLQNLTNALDFALSDRLLGA